MSININLPKELEKGLNHLKQTTKKPKTFHVREALIRFPLIKEKKLLFR